MKIIVIDPQSRTIVSRETDGSTVSYRRILGGEYAEHHVGEDTFPGHNALVYTNGILKGLPVWYLNGVIVWGPLILIGRDNTTVELTVEQVRNKVRFNS